MEPKLNSETYDEKKEFQSVAFSSEQSTAAGLKTAILKR